MKKSLKRTVPVILSSILALVLTSAASAVCGDVNCDSYVNSKDILSIKREIVGFADYEDCDANGDGKINAKDILDVKRHIVGAASLHDWQTEEEVYCTYSGFSYTYCTRCGSFDSYEELPAVGHDFEDGYCSRCGIDEDDAIEYIEVTNASTRKYIIGEAPDFRDSVLTVHFADGTTEDIALSYSFGSENIYATYYSQRLDDNIVFYTDTSVFIESGTNIVTVNFNGTECEVELEVEDVSIDSITVQNEDDGGLTVFAALTDGSVREMKLLDIDVHTVDDSFIGAYIITNNGTFDGGFIYDEDSGAVALMIYSGKNAVTSDNVDELYWLTGYAYALDTYNYLLCVSGDISCYNGTVTEDNIDALIKLAVLRYGFTYDSSDDSWTDDDWTDDDWTDDDWNSDIWDYDLPVVTLDEETGDILIPGELIQLAMWATYGDVDFSLEDSSYYDAETDIYRMSSDMELGIYLPIYPTSHIYADGEWNISVTYTGVNESMEIIIGTVTFSVNDLGQITRFEIG